MGTGFKDYSNYQLIKSLGVSAHPVQVIQRTSQKNPQKKDVWFLKELESVQEAQIECMTGEIYRYLLGPYQPKIRVRKDPGASTVVSSSVKFLSFRELLEKEGNKNNNLIYDKYKKAFQENLDSFMMVMISSIFFEENDLSDNNYGLVVLSGEGNAREFGGFVKIDHGQSFNSLRISEASRNAGVFDVKKKMLGHANIKYFPPVSPRPARDRRVKSDRCTMGLMSNRKYLLSHAFLNTIVTDFLDGRITKDYIQNLQYQPSACPFYDSRLLTLLDYSKDPGPYLLMEYFKYLAIARLIFTSLSALYHIAKNASDIEKVPRVWVDVQKKLIESREHLVSEMKKDPDFLLFCHSQENHIKNLINKSWGEMVQGSERYAGFAGNAFDAGTMNEFSGPGGEYDKDSFIKQTEEYLGSLQKFIEDYPWSTGWGGGKSVVLGGRNKKVPGHVAQMLEVLDLYRKCGLVRLIRSAGDMVDMVEKVNASTSSTRKKTTTEAYQALHTFNQAYAMNLKFAGLSRAAIVRIHPGLGVFL
ncbi:hypothetical protein [Desulfobotulus mexicanus]|uniref:Uncharacterized protein n=1 Tax=Desulfobotulus mexicanus TaxID=2586642 RepID=A0A5S5MDY6_9BACT|nr:hypothetical protein [Desulfobotulus mexicanus]TYT73923.1 hypothetical protein FIM25_12855 [Desulfobotulus mexicanus]